MSVIHFASRLVSVMSPNRFRARVVTPNLRPEGRQSFLEVATAQGLQQVISMLDQGLLCQTTTLPGRSIATTEVGTYGPQQKFPYGTNYDDIELDFIVGGAGRNIIPSVTGAIDAALDPTGFIGGLIPFQSDPTLILQYFTAWQSYIQDPTTWRVEYYKYFTSTITIDLFSRASAPYSLRSKPTYSVRLFEAYPVNVNPVGLSWADTDSLMALPVTFAYRYWRQLDSQTGQVKDGI